MVKNHLDKNGKEYITRDYVEKLDTTLSYGIPIDLRSSEEKVAIEGWKKRHIALEKKEEKHDEKHEKTHDDHRSQH